MQDFRNFSDDRLHTLFSKGRIVSYDSVNQHFDNFDLIASISKNLGIAEVLLRNKIDSVMCGLDSAWLDNVPSKIEIDKPKNEPNPTHDKLVSMQSLGFWVKIVDYYRIHDKIFNWDFLDDLTFKRYYAKNANHLKNGSSFRRYQKARLLIHLLHNLRNRAFHFENLYKLNNDNKPRLSAKIHNPKIVINLETTKIQVFLNDLIDELSKSKLMR